MKIRSDNLRIQAHAGFSLVDVMVGMVIALLGVIIIFQVFSVSEDIKRRTTSGGDALQNGAAALSALGDSIMQAGYGTSVAPLITVMAGGTPSDSIQLSYLSNWGFGIVTPNAFFPAAVAPAATIETLKVIVNSNNQPQLVSAVSGVSAVAVIADGIVLLKVQYGDDTNNDNILDTWTQNTPVNAMAVRIVVVARSAQPEKPSVAGGACDATITNPTWMGSYVTANNPTAVPLVIPTATGANTGLATGDSWQCYRYKTYENTVPLRN